MRLLAGDIGGTKTLLALYQLEGEELVCLREQIYPSQEYASLEMLVSTFLESEQEQPVAACFGVPGPVINERCQGVNLPWLIERKVLEKVSGIAHVGLLNDLQAAALGMLELEDDQLVELNPDARSRPENGNIAVLAAGTGLGEAILYWDGHRHHGFATEGGHSDFVCNCDADDRLLAYLRKRHQGHVSLERVISGPGLFTLYDFLRESDFAPQSPALLKQLEQAADPSAVVSEFALAGKDALCEEAMRMFVRLYGVEAGNLALKCLALGGVMIGGGIAPKILPALQDGRFMQGFLDKGRMGTLLHGLSVRVSLDPRTPLLGSARYAARLLE